MELAIGTYVVFTEADDMNGEVQKGTLGIISGHDRRGDDNTVERYIVTCLDETLHETIQTLYYDCSFLPLKVKTNLIEVERNTEPACECECNGERHVFEDGSLCQCVCHSW